MSPTPRHLYAHIPYCERKCHYCAFNSRAGDSAAAMDRYVRALVREIDGLPGPRRLPLETVYIGGGTPTALAPHQLSEVLRAIRDRAPSAGPVEWTVEANPGTVTPDHLASLRDAGVGRISMGVQTLDPARLKMLGRIHTPEDVATTVRELRDHGFRNINLDLIYGQPDQTLDAWRADVEAILAQEPDHLSLYALQYEEGTVFEAARQRGRLEELPEDLVLEMFSLAHDLVGRAGFELYEISNFARPGKESAHNRAYWRNDPYFGVGAGAWAGFQGQRLRNETDPDRYADRVLAGESPVTERDELTPRDDFLETLLTGLRTRDGVDLDVLAARTGLDPRRTHPEWIASLVRDDLARIDAGHLVLSRTGLWVLDSVMEPFLELAETPG